MLCVAEGGAQTLTVLRGICGVLHAAAPLSTSVMALLEGRSPDIPLGTYLSICSKLSMPVVSA